MNSKIIAIGLTVILALIGAAGDFFIKLSGHGKRYLELGWFLLGLVIYASTAFGWFWVMKHIKLSTLGVFYALSTILFLTAVSIFYFRESINAYEVIGIGLAIVSLLLLGKFA